MAPPPRFLLTIAFSSILIYPCTAFWRTACSVVQTGRIDPILAPGGVSGHVHKMAGASNVNWYSTPDSIQQSNCTSCEVTADNSAYWSPQLYYAHSNGTFEEVTNYGMTVYYLSHSNNETDTTAFPPGFKMLSGDSTLRSFDNTSLTYLNTTPIANRVSFHCIDSSDPNLPEQPYMFRTDCDNGMRAQILFQSCWDGVNTYLPGNAHVDYMSEIGSGQCPPSHPVILPLLFFEVLYWTIDIDQSQGGEFTFAQGDPTGYGFHGDFMNGWDQSVLEDAVANCLSLVDNPNGTISTCEPLAGLDNVNFPRTCVEQPPYVPEQVHVLLPQLPGCNPVTSGPNRAPQMACGVNSSQPISTSTGASAAATATQSASLSTISAPVASSLDTVSAGAFFTVSTNTTTGTSSTTVPTSESTSSLNVTALFLPSSPSTPSPSPSPSTTTLTLTPGATNLADPISNTTTPSSTVVAPPTLPEITTFVTVTIAVSTQATTVTSVTTTTTTITGA